MSFTLGVALVDPCPFFFNLRTCIFTTFVTTVVVGAPPCKQVTFALTEFNRSIRMADVKPETLKPDIANGIYVRFQRNPHIFSVEKHSGLNDITGRYQGE